MHLYPDMKNSIDAFVSRHDILNAFVSTHNILLMYKAHYILQQELTNKSKGNNWLLGALVFGVYQSFSSDFFLTAL